MTVRQRIFSLVLVIIFAIGTVGAFAAGKSEAKVETNTVSFMWWGDDARHAATNAAADAFERANPGVQVIRMPNPFDGYQTKILIELSSGTAADLFCFSTEWLPDAAFEARPVLADLYEWDELIDLSTLDSGVLRGGEVNGRLVGIPTGISGWSYSYNLNVLTDYAQRSGAGLPPGPGETWTVEEYIEYARAFKSFMGDDYALMIPDFNSTVHHLIRNLSNIAGNFYISPRAELQFTERDLVETFKLFQRFTEAGVLPSGELQVESFSGDGGTYVAAGKWVGWGNWTSNFQANSNIANSEIGIMAYPIAGKNPTHDGLFTRPAQFWMVHQNSRNKELAVRLLDFITNAPEGIRGLGLSRGVPPTAHGQQLLINDGVLDGAMVEATRYLTESANASYNPFIIIAEVREVMREEYSQFITGRKTAERAAADLMPELERITGALRRRLSLN